MKIRDLFEYGSVKLEKVPDRLGHDVVYQLDTTKLKTYLGDDFVFTPLESFLHGMCTRINFLEEMQ